MDTHTLGERYIRENPAKAGTKLGLVHFSPHLSVIFVLSYQISEAAKRRVGADRLLLSFRGCLLNQNVSQKRTDDGKRKTTGFGNTFWETTVIHACFRRCFFSDW